MTNVTTACSCRWLHTITVYDPKCPLHTRPTTTETSEADCAHVWDRVLTQEGTPTQRQCQRCGIIQSGNDQYTAAEVREVIEVTPYGKARGMLHRYAELLEGYESLKQQTDVGANDDAVVLEGIEAFVLMVQVIADQTATRSFAQIAEDELVKLRERVAMSARS